VTACRPGSLIFAQPHSPRVHTPSTNHDPSRPTVDSNLTSASPSSFPTRTVVATPHCLDSPTRPTPTPLRRDAMKGDDARVAASASPTELQTPVARAPTRREEDASSTRTVPRLADASDAKFSTPRGAAVTSDGDASSPDGSPSTRAVEALRVAELPSELDRDRDGERDEYVRAFGDDLRRAMEEEGLELADIGDVLAALAAIMGDTMREMFDPKTWECG